MSAPQRPQPGLSPSAEMRLRAKLAKRCCSSSWIDEHFRSVPTINSKGEEVTVTVFDSKAYPPPAPTSPMRKCRRCEVLYPAYYLTSDFIVAGEIFRHWHDAIAHSIVITLRIARQMDRHGLKVSAVRGLRIQYTNRDGIPAEMVVDHARVVTDGLCLDCVAAVDHASNNGYASHLGGRLEFVDMSALH